MTELRRETERDKRTKLPDEARNHRVTMDPNENPVENCNPSFAFLTPKSDERKILRISDSMFGN